MPDTNLKTTVQSQMMAAMKAGDKFRTQVLRMVLSEIKAKEADDPQAIPQEAVAAYAKKLQKAKADMERLNQAERAKTLDAELAVVAEFLPRPMDDAALAQLVGDIMAQLSASGPLTKKDQGRATGAIMKAVVAAGASADPGKVRTLIESKLT